MSNPYRGLQSRAFWRSAVAECNGLELSDLYRKRFEIGAKTRVSTGGSCFAQHVGRQLLLRGYNSQDFEPSPPFLPADKKAEFGYGLYSARYGNIYTARQMVQLMQRAYGKYEPSDSVWTIKGNGFADAFRPSIEPDGFSSREELEEMRSSHLAAVRRMFECTDVFVYTLGLTEAWLSTADGAAYPTCPGTIAGEFDGAKYRFHNFTASEVVADLEAFIALARAVSPQMRILLTVSPVPLTATASGDHVLVATTYSKSVLRAAAGELYQRYDFVDYFPSYEIVTAPSSRGMAFEPNMRSVSAQGVAHVMSYFFAEHALAAGKSNPSSAVKPEPADDLSRIPTSDVVCDEEKLELQRS